ncbi:hypothetical protein OAS39_08020, partial [Pirellulales bacterium]|nr:hypothetical protein [Pirellulales bacterium]
MFRNLNTNKRVAAIRRHRRRTHPRQRRGILLLISLSMLVLFMMVGTAFVVSARLARDSAKAQTEASEIRATEEQQARLLDEVARQLLRDTNNEKSSLRFHSLLRDMYGNDAMIATLDANNGCTWDQNGTDSTMGQILELRLDVDGFGINRGVVDYFGVPMSVAELSSVDDAYNGLVMTFLDNGAQGQSTRIVGYVPVANPDPLNPVSPILRVIAPPLADGRTVSVPADLNGSRILINGRVFNGTGSGLDTDAAPPAPRLAADENVDGTQRPIALLPNPRFVDVESIADDYFLSPAHVTYLQNQYGPAQLTAQTNLAKAVVGWNGLGASDESYDAPDFQNMLLGLLQRRPEETGQRRPLPSLHRPALINYWDKKLEMEGVDLENDPNMLRKVMLRPNWIDHPSFDGSNPEFAAKLGDNAARLQQMIDGPYDVDNDNSGIRDSVLVDFGAPVMLGPNGRLVRPMAAVLCIDLDGRLNVNAHNSRQIAGMDSMPAGKTMAGVISSDLPRGAGYGPAEISLRSVLGSSVDEVINGGVIGGRRFNGRYGQGFDDQRQDFDNQPGKLLDFDLNAQLKMQGVPDQFRDDRLRTAYTTPPDYKGRYSTGINDFGQPEYEAWGDVPASANDTRRRLDANSPYELDLSNVGPAGENTAGNDAPYSLAELERVLRSYDADAATLPPRLAALGNFLGSNLRNRNLVTTDSFDSPAPNVVLPAWMILGPDMTANNADDYERLMSRSPTSASFADLIEYRVRLAAHMKGQTVTSNQLRRAMLKLVPRDLVDGVRLNPNRPFGNFRDDDEDGVADEPGEDETIDGFGFWKFRRNNTGPAPAQISPAEDDFEQAPYEDADDPDQDGTVDRPNVGAISRRVAAHNFRRQQAARDFFVTAMALIEPIEQPTSVSGRAQIRRLAQWAINAVDYQDADSAMSPFEYDANPFAGWRVDGDISDADDRNGPDMRPNTNDDVGGLVWGTERPELIITETMAWHDQRTEDHADEDPDQDEEAASISDSKNPDDDLDQLRRPRGAFFIEIYNPWSESPAATSDLHQLRDQADGLG